MSLNPTYKPDAAGVWWLYWTPDPDALLYDLIVNGQHSQAVKSAATAKLGVKPSTPPQISAAHVGVYETAVDVSPPLPPPFTATMSIHDGQALSVPLPWTVSPSGPVSRVQFFIDGVLKWNESYAPFVFNGDGNLLDPRTLAPGVHVLSAVCVGAGATITVAGTVAVQSPVVANTDGDLGFCIYATTPADPYTTNPVWQPWIKQHWQRGIIWDPPIGWFVNGWPYRDAIVASYTDQGDPNGDNPYIARNSLGHKLKVNYKDNQWLADFSRADYRQAVLTWAKARIANGKHVGVYFDDVNLSVSTKDSVTGATGSLPAGWTALSWEENLCSFMEFLKANLPGAEICHNAVWFDSPNHDGKDPYTQRRLHACTHVLLERGFGDTGIHYGTDQWSFDRLFTYIDTCHAAGAGCVHLDYGATKQSANFNFACALLCSNGKDYVYGYGWKPDAWDPMYDRNLGASKGPRVKTSASTYERTFVDDKGVTRTIHVDLAARTAAIPA